MNDNDDRKSETESGGMERRTHPEGNQNQEGQNRTFVQANLQHFDYKNPLQNITVGIVGLFVLGGTLTLSGYLAGSGRVKTMIHETAPDVEIQKGVTIREKFISIDQQAIRNENDFEKCKSFESRINYLEHWNEAPPAPKPKIKRKP